MWMFVYSHVFGTCMLFSMIGLLSVSKLSCETSFIQTNSSKNSSELFMNNENENISFHEFDWLMVSDKTPSRTSSITSKSGDRTCRWSNTTMSAREFQTTYCCRRCRGNLLVTGPGPDWCPRVACFPCDCNKPICEFYGTCCPDVHAPSAYSNTVSDRSSKTTHKHWLGSNITGDDITLSNETSINLVCGGNGDKGYLSKRSCLWNYPDSDVISKCQKDKPTAEQDIDTFLHVTDNITEHTFYNQYCATCNNVQQFTPWILSVECFSYMTIYTSRTPADLLRLSMAPHSGCKPLQIPPPGLRSCSCDRDWFVQRPVDTCNETGEWDEYDEDVIKGCEDIFGLVNRVRDFRTYHDVVYKNLFCAMCNMKGCTECDADYTQSVKAIAAGSALLLPFSVLLNFGPEGSFRSHKRNFSSCSPDTDWTSPDSKCLPLLCSPGKILTNGSCSTVFNQIRGLLYQIHVYYIPTVPIVKTINTAYISDLHQTYLDLFANKLEQIIYRVVNKFQIKVAMVFSDKTFPTGENITDEHVNTTMINWFVIDGYILAGYLLSRDELETLIIRELSLNNITVAIDTNTTMTFVPMLYPQRKQKRQNCSYSDTELMSCIYSSLPSDASVLYHADEKLAQQAIMIEPHLNCPFVQFYKTEYVYMNDSMTKSQSCSISVYFKNARMTFYDRTELNMVSIDDNGTLRVCVELLNTKNVIRSELINNSMLKMSLYLLTLICVIASSLCLTMTLMTYLLFPVLCSVAGKNNIFLSASLLLAQISLLATSHVSESGHLCSILAICTHFLWLSMFCWCFICCFHMFCIFSAKTRSIQSSTKSEMTYMIKRVVACCVIPGLIVIGVIATNLAMSEGQFIGYGNRTCFVDSQITLIITLVVPLCLIILLNFIFFSITVIKIYNVRKLQTREFRKDDHNNLYIYIKLSSMTGIFWVLSVISETTDNDPLRFISIVLNGLQGVFIFLSYICNRRVLRLYLKLLGVETYLSTTVTSDRSTIAKVVSDIN